MGGGSGVGGAGGVIGFSKGVKAAAGGAATCAGWAAAAAALAVVAVIISFCRLVDGGWTALGCTGGAGGAAGGEGVGFDTGGGATLTGAAGTLLVFGLLVTCVHRARKECGLGIRGGG